MELIIGIDPGINGALCLLEPGNNLIADLFDMPLTTDASGRSVVDGTKLHSMLGPHRQKLTLAILERVGSSPSMGVTSAFRFGEGYGVIQGVLASMPGLRITKPMPAVWKAQMGLTAKKLDSLAMARRIFGADMEKRWFSLKKHEGRAEAALLAVFGSKII